MTGQRAHGRGLRIIAVYKLLRVWRLLALGIGALNSSSPKTVAVVAEHWINIFQVDPHSHYIRLLLAKLSIVDEPAIEGTPAQALVIIQPFF